MFDWIKKFFGTEKPEVTEQDEKDKNKSQDDFMTQTLIFPTANHALDTTHSTAAGDGGGDSGGDGGGGASGN